MCSYCTHGGQETNLYQNTTANIWRTRNKSIPEHKIMQWPILFDLRSVFNDFRSQRNCYYKECFIASNEKVASNKNDMCRMTNNSEVIF